MLRVVRATGDTIWGNEVSVVCVQRLLKTFLWASGDMSLAKQQVLDEIVQRSMFHPCVVKILSEEPAYLEEGTIVRA